MRVRALIVCISFFIDISFAVIVAVVFIVNVVFLTFLVFPDGLGRVLRLNDFVSIFWLILALINRHFAFLFSNRFGTYFICLIWLFFFDFSVLVVLLRVILDFDF